MHCNGIAWLASSSADITRARGVLDALRKPGVIDELGFLMLNGAFAQRLYPGLTTIMTRARYLFFIPAIYRHLEQSGRGRGKDVDNISRDLQFALRNALEKNEPSFIGKEGGRRLIRLPSAIYWNALGQLGIATRQVSESTYQRQLSEGRFGRTVYKDDDEVVHEREDESIWTAELSLSSLMADGAFPDTIDFRLRRKEARFLQKRYAALEPDGHRNLVTVMVGRGLELNASGPLQGFEYPWNVPMADPDLVGVLDHAKRLSMMARGATLQYYRMLLDIKKIDDERVDAAFAEWWAEAVGTLRSWDLREFFMVVTAWGGSRGPKDRAFIEGWLAQITGSGSGSDALRNSSARAIIQAREDHVRPGKQRLRVQHQRESWELPQAFASGLYQMDYRHRVGRQIARDIVDGLVGGQA